ncbi:glutathione S-transferase [Pseudoalteromonas xiamenensis]
MDVAKLKLTYFDVHGGRAEPIRLSLYLGGIEFEDYRFSYGEFPEVRKSTPLGQVPVLEINGLAVTQSNALTTYAGKLAGLYPKDDFQALLCEEIMGSVEDVTSRIVSTFGLQGEALIAAREKVTQDYLIPHLNWLTTKLGDNKYFIENTLSVADLKTLAHLAWLNSGRLDHIASSLVAEHASTLQSFFNQLMQHPKIVEYYATH